jgi:hypothetical protein
VTSDAGLPQLDPSFRALVPSWGSPPSSPGVRPLPRLPADVHPRVHSRFARIGRTDPHSPSAGSSHGPGPVPPSRFLTALAAFSTRMARVCCTPLPAEVRRVSRRPPPSGCYSDGADARSSRRSLTPLEELPSSAAVPRHRGPCPPAVIPRSLPVGLPTDRPPRSATPESASRHSREPGCESAFVLGIGSLHPRLLRFRSPETAAVGRAGFPEPPRRPRGRLRDPRSPASHACSAPPVTRRRGSMPRTTFPPVLPCGRTWLPVASGFSPVHSVRRLETSRFSPWILTGRLVGSLAPSGSDRSAKGADRTVARPSPLPSRPCPSRSTHPRGWATEPERSGNAAPSERCSDRTVEVRSPHPS